MIDPLIDAMVRFGDEARPIMTAAVAAASGACDLTERDLEILAFIERYEPVAFAEIVRRAQHQCKAGRSTSRLSVAITALFKRGFVRKRFGDVDQRQPVLSITAKARRVLADVARARRRAFKVMRQAMELNARDARTVQRAFERGLVNLRQKRAD